MIVTSHVLEEVERFGSNVLVMSKGRLAASGDFHEIRALMDDRPLRLRVRTDAARALGGALLGAGVVVGIRLEDDGSLLLDTQDARRLAHELPVSPGRRARGSSRSVRSTATSKASSATSSSDDRDGPHATAASGDRSRRSGSSTRSSSACS